MLNEITKFERGQTVITRTCNKYKILKKGLEFYICLNLQTGEECRVTTKNNKHFLYAI